MVAQTVYFEHIRTRHYGACHFWFFILSLFIYRGHHVPIHQLGSTPSTSTAQAAESIQATLGGRAVAPIKTDASAEHIANRQELEKGHGLLQSLRIQLTALANWLANALGFNKTDSPKLIPLSTNEPRLDTSVKKQTLEGGQIGIIKAALIESISSTDLRSEHTKLATGNGALRSLATAFVSVHFGSSIEDTRNLISLLSKQNIGGHELREWGTVQGPVTSWLETASDTQLNEAALQLTNALSIVKGLAKAVELELSGDKETAKQLASELLSKLNANGLKPAQIDWNAFTQDKTPKEIFESLGKNAMEQFGERFARKGDLPFNLRHRDLDMVKNSLSVPTQDGKSNHYNAHLILNGTAIASQAPMGGADSVRFADLLVNSDATFVINLQNHRDAIKPGFVNYWNLEKPFKPSDKETGNSAQFVSTPHEDSTIDLKQIGAQLLTVTGTSGVTKNLVVINVPIPDHGVIDKEPLHEAVMASATYRQALGGVPVIHCNAGVGRTGLYALAEKIYDAFKAGTLNSENYVAIVTSYTNELRGERSAQMVQTDKQFAALLDYAEALISGELTTSAQDEEEEAIYENGGFQHEAPAVDAQVEELKTEQSSESLYENVPRRPNIAPAVDAQAEKPKTEQSSEPLYENFPQRPTIAPKPTMTSAQ
ncbi:Protein tyrosine phosphatase [Pseudomonas sp. LAMO17WK12:I10]|uniref:protein-tyrosine phosphatase family protein n=1 Tax=unclassified Pseudomonas TaxID=196821 RepID=UPI000BC7C42B|nr:MULTISPECIES: protein-tyrosine phosphatase family protein [unclassified Pseudomonas]PXX54011.1 protein tyrosine phosphatase [Pseudomonas sp. LAMO17WK12:I9]SNY51954.1 Protein tyrosine phosphatase [Pseudomonas sp. LAMO17WK12:I10]